MKGYNLILMFTSLFFIASFSSNAQKDLKSPPASATGEIDGVSIEIDYHQPAARGRKMLGEKEPYGEVWRTGANKATTISFSEDVSIEGQPLPKGKYALFTIPGKDQWTIIFNKNANQWGAFNYDQAEDALRVKVDAEETEKYEEVFNINIEDEGVVLRWEDTKVQFSVSK